MESIRIINFLHLIAAVIWVGGAIFMNIVLAPSMEDINPGEQGKLMAGVAKRFTILSWLSVIILLITGASKTPAGMMFDTASRFGMFLTIKHVTIILMILAGLTITFIAGPKMKKNAPKPGEMPSQEFMSARKLLSVLSVLNTILGILVVLFISMAR
jgi:putative copper resistance protein D